MIWADRYSHSPVAGQVARTIAGGLAIFVQAMSAGRPVTLEARDGVAWLTQSQVDALVVMAAQAGATFTFTYDGETQSVRFAHHTPPVVDFVPIWPFAEQYTGAVKLITV
jgi:hypothetical protein